MSRMLPPSYSADIKSNAEKRVFDLFRTDPDTGDWICLHSLGLAKHVRQVYGEIDFVLLIPGEGVFCLEIKGGNVSRTDGVWTFTDRYGNGNTRTKSPFAQAKDNMFSLVEAVQNAFGRDHRLSRMLYGWGVLFIDIVWDREETEAHRWQIYDRDFRRPISAFLKQVSNETRRDLQNKLVPTHADIEELTEFLRGDFELVVAAADRLKSSDDQIHRLTLEQYRCLDGMERNPRCFFEGGAGTGKTFLAVETARREASKGRRVLLICFNRLLGAWLSTALPYTRYEGITVGNFHSVLENIIAKSSLYTEFQQIRRQSQLPAEKRTFFRETTPFYASLAVSEGIVEPFDMLVVDEGQDLIAPEYLDILDTLLKGGLAGGRWAFYSDLHRQAIYQDGPADNVETGADRLRSMVAERAPHSSSYVLTVNCRNTRPIGEETALLSGFDVPPFLSSDMDGPSVDYRFYADAEEQKQKLTALLNDLHDEGVPPEAIHILSPTSRHQSILSDTSNLPYTIIDLDEKSIFNPAGSIGFSTIHSYKGLENSVIILTDIRRLDRLKDQALLYVGMSRARQRLFVMLADSTRATYNESVKRSFMKGR